MDTSHSISMEKLYQCHDRRSRYAYRTTSPKITKQHWDNSPKFIGATFNGNPSATIIPYYRPTNVSEETELIAFYDELFSLVRSIPKHSVLICGDMNAQIGKNGNHKYSLHNSLNRNGQHLTDFTIEKRLRCLNTIFQKREGRAWTYTYSTDKLRLYNIRNENIALWIARFTPHSRVCPSITELSWQKYVLALEKMPP